MNIYGRRGVGCRHQVCSDQEQGLAAPRVARLHAMPLAWRRQGASQPSQGRLLQAGITILSWVSDAPIPVSGALSAAHFPEESSS
jgi:hypothetical protein